MTKDTSDDKAWSFEIPGPMADHMGSQALAYITEYIGLQSGYDVVLRVARHEPRLVVPLHNTAHTNCDDFVCGTGNLHQRRKAPILMVLRSTPDAQLTEAVRKQFVRDILDAVVDQNPTNSLQAIKDVVDLLAAAEARRNTRETQ